MRSSPALPLLVFVLLIGSFATGVVGQPTPTTTETATQGGLTMAVQLEQDGDARWNVTARFPLHSENDTEAFERLAEDFENGDSDVGFDVTVFETAASEAAIQTGREMAIRNDGRSAHVGEDVGILSLTFTWTNFSQTSDERLAVGDVFATRSGTWLPRLTADQTLVISPPDGYSVHSVQTRGAEVDNRDLVVEGPATFERGEPSVTYAGGADENDVPLDLLLLLVGVLSATVVGVYAWSRHLGSGPLDSLWTDDEETDAERVEPPGGVGADAEPSTEGDDADEPNDEEVDVELLSDEERIVRMLEEEGGRMKQADIVKETGWSNAKVSQLLSAMAEDGQVNKLRIGRENLISLPDEEFSQFD